MVFARILINFHMDSITMELVSDLCVVLFVLETFKCIKYTFNLNRGEIYSEHFNNKLKIDRFFVTVQEYLRKFGYFGLFFGIFYFVFIWRISLS